MTSRLDPGVLSPNELIIALLDDELDDGARQLVNDLISTDQQFRERFRFFAENAVSLKDAFGALMAEAPTKKLVAGLPEISGLNRNRPASSRRHFLAGAACALIGAIIGGAVVGLAERPGSTTSEGWRSVVASYMRLYSTVTLASLTDDPLAEQDQIARVSAVIQLPLSPGKLDIAGIPFKRAQLLSFNEKPLAQIAYLDPQRGPLALCIIKSSVGTAAIEEEKSFGMNIVFWSSVTHSFMLIGHNPTAELHTIADRMSATLVA